MLKSKLNFHGTLVKFHYFWCAAFSSWPYYTFGTQQNMGLVQENSFQFHRYPNKLLIKTESTKRNKEELNGSEYYI